MSILSDKHFHNEASAYRFIEARIWAEKDWLAEEAVCCEPVSPAEFPDKWQITGNFGDLIPNR